LTLFSVFALVTIASSPGLYVIFVAVLLVGLTAELSPLYNALRAKIALNRGRPAVARVRSLNNVTTSHLTLDALQNGFVEGTRLLELGGSQVEEKFATDAPWARELAPGSLMQVVIDDLRSEVVLELGLASPVEA
jgi:hypothetical protein